MEINITKRDVFKSAKIDIGIKIDSEHELSLLIHDIKLLRTACSRDPGLPMGSPGEALITKMIVELEKL